MTPKNMHIAVSFGLLTKSPIRLRLSPIFWTQPQLVGHRQKENREAILMQAAAENPERGDDSDHAPAGVKAGDTLPYAAGV